MAVSKVSIANRGLQLLGAKRIESLDQNHPNAKSMSAAYDAVRDAELRRFRWNFSIRRASIAADGSQTEWGKWNRYVVPNDFLMLIRDDESGVAPDWRIEGSDVGTVIITADASPLQIRYVAMLDDPNLYDALFRESFAASLAKATCYEITQSTAKLQNVGAAYDAAIAEATRIGSIEEPAQEFPEDSWILVQR
jgi:hypothetical protein